MRQIRTLLIVFVFFLIASIALPAKAEDDPPGSSFDYCNQVPVEQRPGCIQCMGTRTVTKKKVHYANEGQKIYTAVGCLSVSGEGLASDLIKFLLGIAGGVSLLSMIGAAFILSTSRGESAKVKNAKELITASVSGLLFLIFSVIILQFIGVTILKIPGLG